MQCRQCHILLFVKKNKFFVLCCLRSGCYNSYRYVFHEFIYISLAGCVMWCSLPAPQKPSLLHSLSMTSVTERSWWRSTLTEPQACLSMSTCCMQQAACITVSITGLLMMMCWGVEIKAGKAGKIKLYKGVEGLIDWTYGSLSVSISWIFCSYCFILLSSKAGIIRNSNKTNTLRVSSR